MVRKTSVAARAITAALFLSASSGAQAIAQSKPSSAPSTLPICETYKANIEALQMKMALEKALGDRDDSAPRETNRVGKRVAHLLTIQITMTQMAAMKCAPYIDPIDETRYATNADQCAMALTSATRGSTSVPMSCETTNWSPAY